MTKDEVEFVARFQGFVLGNEDIKPKLEDDGLWSGLRGLEIMEPDAEIRFVGPDGGPLGTMVGPFHGVEGLRAGFREWLDPWEEFRIQADQVLDAGSGRVVSLVEQRGKMKGGAEVSEQSASITHLREGKIVGIDFYLDQDQARRDAGLA